MDIFKEKCETHKMPILSKLISKTCRYMSDPLKKFSDSTFPGGTGCFNSGLGGTATHIVLSTSPFFVQLFHSVQQSVLDFEGHYFLMLLLFLRNFGFLLFFFFPSCSSSLFLNAGQSMRESAHFVSSFRVEKFLNKKKLILKVTNIYLQDFQI